MRVLITGGAGFLGTALTRVLTGRGHQVRVLDRNPSEALRALGAEQRTGDATDPSTLRQAVAGQEVVIHLAGIRRSTDPAEFMRVNAEGTRTALEACLSAAPGLSRFVLAGSRAAIGPSADAVDERAPFGPVEPYGASKAEAERIALSYAARLPVSVARPPRIMGPATARTCSSSSSPGTSWRSASPGRRGRSPGSTSTTAHAAFCSSPSGPRPRARRSS